ncbi:MAG: hypothetical protein IJ580_08910 [Prevotella sp.]|nr:hypothetical protein [Prevotella sp.]
MKKTYLAQCLAVLTLGWTAAGCSSDSDDANRILTEEEALENAEDKLGITIDPNQTWLMTQQVTAAITINEDYGETYSVKLFSNDPLVDGVGCVVAEGTIGNGETFNATFSCPSSENSLMVGVTNSQGYTYYRNVVIDNGKIVTTFGETAAANAPRRSQTSPSVPDITIPDAAYVNKYLDGAKEPTAANTTDNYDNSGYEGGGQVWVVDVPGHNEEIKETKWVDGKEWSFYFNDPYTKFSWLCDGNGDLYGWVDASRLASEGLTQADVDFWKTYVRPFNNQDWRFYGSDNKNDATTVLMGYLRNTNGVNRMHWVTIQQERTEGGYQEVVTGYKWIAEQGHYENREGTWKEDETYVRKFVIKNGKSWDDYINVLETEGLTDGKPNDCERTIVVQGTWNLKKNQKVGSRGQIIVASGGVLTIDEDCTIKLVNQARLVVMPGGTVNGSGNIEVTNGNEDGFENYNGGTIQIGGTFNNNFGKFYNYNYFECNTYAAGGGGTSFYNHGVAHINNGGSTDSYVSTNARIYNACQWYCENDMRAYILELAQGSYFYVGGQLQMSTGNDGSSDPTYVAMAAGALLDVNELSNNLTNWIGPEEGWAVCQFGSISYLNWNPGTPTNAGYFINNIAVSIDDKTPLNHDGNTPTYEHFKYAVANGYGTGEGLNNYGTTAVGNGKTVLVNRGGANLKLDASTEFEGGVKGCTPGYNGTPQSTVTTYPVYSYAFEDTNGGDYDMNDVVIRVQEVTVDGKQKIKLTLVAVGAELNLNIRLYPAPSTRAENELAHYEGTPTNLKINNQEEAHLMLNAKQGVMTNTGDGAKANTQYTMIDKGNYDPAHLPLAIYSTAQGEMRLASGRLPFGIIVPGNWKWPIEYVAVTRAYNSTNTAKGDQSFAKFGETAGSAKEWYNYPSSTDLVMDESTLGF